MDEMPSPNKKQGLIIKSPPAREAVVAVAVVGVFSYSVETGLEY
jgi:hypothetical protein